MTHTPGPWTVEDGEIWALADCDVHPITAEGVHEGKPFYNHTCRDSETVGANLRLMAAAPDMHEALGPDASGRHFPELLRAVADYLRGTGGGPMEDCLRIKADQIDAALSKAHG